jgi:glycosyltransferase involved in cell wall biosynthesis
MLFSVIIPTYNRAALLCTALDSVFAQTFTDYEVIVVDDGSTDGTAAMVASYGGRVRYFQQQNKGPGAARNLGAQHATGEYLAFLDSDDLWFPWTLENYRRAIEKFSRPSFIAGTHYDFNDTEQLQMPLLDEPAFEFYHDYFETATIGVWVGTCAAVIQRSVFEEVGGFVDEYINAEDSDLWLRLGIAHSFVNIINPPAFGYRRHSESAVANLRKTHAGLVHMIKNERQGIYPGGSARAAERQNIITRHVRPASLSLAKCSECSLALDLYWKTLRWHIESARVKYLFGFWIILLKHLVQHSKRPS